MVTFSYVLTLYFVTILTRTAFVPPLLALPVIFLRFFQLLFLKFIYFPHAYPFVLRAPTRKHYPEEISFCDVHIAEGRAYYTSLGNCK